VRLRVVSWNLDSRPTGQLDAKVALLREVAPDLALLQEVRRPVYKTLLPHALAHERMFERTRLFSWGRLSTDLSDPPGSDRRLGCAVLGVASTALLSARLLPAAAFPVPGADTIGFVHRTVVARVAVPGGRTLTACSFHARPAVSRETDSLRPAFHTGIAGWLAAQAGTVLFGMDAGAPEVDHPDAERSVFAWPAPTEGGAGEDRLLGATPDHQLRDTLRQFLDDSPPERAKVIAERPDGPLAMSHCAANRPVRYDHVWATADLSVARVEYLYEEAVAAGSDHALVVVDFDL
jgi:endonuclease/exonuclease/phosphatase family metal-dependent hydrolase